MTDRAQSDEFMKQYMDTCKEQIEKLVKDPELLNQTLKPFMQMSQQLIEGGILDGNNMPDMIPSLEDMDINKIIFQIKSMIEYIKSNYKELMKNDVHIQELDRVSRKLRILVKKLIEKIETNKQ